MANAEQGSERTEEFRKSEVERVMVWRKNNPDKYNAYMRRYSKSEKVLKRRKQRYQENIDEERKQTRERTRRFRAKRKQQQSIDIFPQQEQ